MSSNPWLDAADGLGWIAYLWVMGAGVPDLSLLFVPAETSEATAATGEAGPGAGGPAPAPPVSEREPHEVAAA